MESLDLVGWLRGTVLARSPGQTISPMHALRAMYARAILEAAGKTGAGCKQGLQYVDRFRPQGVLDRAVTSVQAHAVVNL